MSAGVRYDYYNSGFGGSTNPRIALIYHPASSTTAKLLYGSAFRAPVPYESNPDYGPFYVGNPKLQPEKIRSVEGILEQGLGSHLRASGSVFYNRITNLITLETDTTTGLSVYENSQAATAKGVEVGAERRPGREADRPCQLQLYANSELGDGTNSAEFSLESGEAKFDDAAIPPETLRCTGRDSTPGRSRRWPEILWEDSRS